MKKAEREWEWWHVALTVSGGALAVLLLWAVAVMVRAGQAPTGYTEIGTFGDSFAPIVGALNALAIGGALASVFMQRTELHLQRDEMKLQREEMAMQREEMEEARKQYTAQAVALDLANKLARRANELATSAQLLEAGSQLAEIDRQGSEAIDALTLEGGGRKLWHELLRSTKLEATPSHLDRFRTGNTMALVKQRERLLSLMKTVQDFEDVG